MLIGDTKQATNEGESGPVATGLTGWTAKALQFEQISGMPQTSLVQLPPLPFPNSQVSCDATGKSEPHL